MKTSKMPYKKPFKSGVLRLNPSGFQSFFARDIGIVEGDSFMEPKPTSLLAILHERAKTQPRQLAYRFLKDGEQEEVCLTFEALDRYARSIGARLQANTTAGERVLLLLPPGLDFIAAFYGCLYAKTIAIPVIPPHPVQLEKSLSATFRIMADAKPAAALLSLPLYNAIQSHDAVRNQFKDLSLLVLEDEKHDEQAEKWEPPSIRQDELAFLQYTSGSTSAPKGVMVSHGNLLHNLNIIETSTGLNPQSRPVFWLPPYHDMGLISGILQSVYTGYTVTLLPHLMFLQRPIRWLQAISRYRATLSGGPNFAYDLCLRKIKPEQREQLDLSSWEIAFNGAEPIYPQTLDQFADFFSPCGFRREAFFPCYGLAEATLIVTGGPPHRWPPTVRLVKSALEENQVLLAPENSSNTRTVVSSGQNLGKQTIRIVNPETLTRCQADQIGEVWVSGPSIALGYWNQAPETASIFGPYLSDPEEGPFLRTGDLGFQLNGELYITGRLKNLIIIDGKNHYPHDIEKTVESVHPAILPAGCAVFSTEDSGMERVIVVTEIQQKLLSETTRLIPAIRKAVAEHHDLSVHDIKCCLPGSIPRTTSGKIKHFLCKKNYQAGTLKEIILP